MNSAAEFTVFHVNSREFTKKSHFFALIHANSREFTNFIERNSQIFTLNHEIFFHQYGRQITLKIASHGLFHKKSFIFPIREGNMDCFEYERFFVKKPMRGYFEHCLPKIQVKKRFRENV
jgi:hypothetical protein